MPEGLEINMRETYQMQEKIDTYYSKVRKDIRNTSGELSKKEQKKFWNWEHSNKKIQARAITEKKSTEKKECLKFWTSVLRKVEKGKGKKEKKRQAGNEQRLWVIGLILIEPMFI